MSEPVLPVESPVHWFGPSWGGPVCRPELEDEAPVGSACHGACSKPVQPGEPGITLPLVGASGAEPARAPYHLTCFVQLLLGER